MAKQLKIIIIVLLAVSSLAQDNIFAKYYQECRKIAEAMTLQQKVGQTIQADFEAVTDRIKDVTNPDEAVSLDLGSLLVSGNAAPTESGNLAKLPSLQQEKLKQILLKANETNWKKLTDRFVNLGINVTTKDGGKYKIKFLLGTDAVHGDQHTVGSVLFPHNIGLSCSRNEGNFENVGFWTKQGVKKSGFNFVFAPTLAVSHNPQWGRYYQSLGQDDSYIAKYAESFVKGLQQVSNGKINGALATAKHFFGDGSTLYGCNEGNANVMNFKSYIDHNIKGYVGSAKANVGSVMISYSAINWVPNSFNSQFLLGVLREDAGFNGFTISDYDDVEAATDMLLPRTFMNVTEQEAYSLMVNAGTDMFMISHKAPIQRIRKFIKRVYERNYVPEVRLTEAVTRILTVKMAMGLVQKLQSSEDIQIEKKVQTKVEYPASSSGNEYQDSLTAVRESLVLLKNSNVLPVRNLASTIKYVVLIGEKMHNINRLTKIQLFRNFDNIGMQCGGWSVRWQGWEGNDFWSGALKTKSNASSVLDALLQIQKINKFQILYPNYTSLTNELTIDEERRRYVETLKTKRKDMNSRNTLIIGVFGEYPYAESVGDVNIPYCKVDGEKGCLYNPYLNTYAPAQQSRTLKLELSKFESEVLTTIKEADKAIPFVSVLLSGRPLLVQDVFAVSDAMIAAWLPGTSGGQGIIDAITGAYVIKPKESPLKNTLSMDWPRDMESLSNFPIYGSDGAIPKFNDPLFSVGFGLSTAGNSKILTAQE